MSAAPVQDILWRWFTLRHWRQSATQSLLLLLVLALGIGVFFAVRLANRAALASFQNFTGLVATGSDWIVRPASGQLDESVLPALRRAAGGEPVVLLATIEAAAAWRPPDAAADEMARLVGLDLVALQNLRAFTPPGESASAAPPGAALDAAPVLGDSTAIFVSSALARRASLSIGGTFTVKTTDAPSTLTVRGILPDPPGRPALPDDLVLMDLPAMQRLIGSAGRIDRVECIVPPGPGLDSRRAGLGERLRAAAADRWLVNTPGERKEQAAQMTRAFRLNLTILSLLALVVGLYLIFQALDAAVVRRSGEIAILRSLGVTPAQIRRAWLVESLTFGVVGGLLGALIGWAGAQVAVRFVGRTVDALYFSTSVSQASLHPGEFWAAIALAATASMLAGWSPAANAARTPPAQLLTRGTAPPMPGPRWLRARWVGPVFAIAAILGATLPPLRLSDGGRIPAGGYAAAAFGVLAAAAMGGHWLGAIARGARRIAPELHMLRLASSQLVRPSGRHRLATASLCCAVAMTAGMAILVGSFDHTMRRWISVAFQADLYLAAPGRSSSDARNRIPEATWRAVTTRPEVEASSVMHVTEIELPGGACLLWGTDTSYAQRYGSVTWLDAPRDGDFAAAASGAAVFVSESFSERYRQRRGDAITLPTPAGSRKMRIAGIFADYGNERGSIVMDRAPWQEWFRDTRASNIIVKLREPAQLDAVKSSLRREYPALDILDHASLRGEVLRIFRQTFSTTHALEAIGLAVAILGVAMTLASALLERRPELTTLRSLGLSSRELARTAAWEGALLAASGIASGMLAALGLGWLLVHVINKQTFGWTLQFQPPWTVLAIIAASVLAAATVAAHWVGSRTARLPIEHEE